MIVMSSDGALPDATGRLRRRGRLPRRLGDAPTAATRFLTLEQVAEELGVGYAGAYRLVRTGELPGIKLGGRGVWRVERAVLDEWRGKAPREAAE